MLRANAMTARLSRSDHCQELVELLRAASLLAPPHFKLTLASERKSQ
jgi:hypothetical protein